MPVSKALIVYYIGTIRSDITLFSVSPACLSCFSILPFMILFSLWYSLCLPKPMLACLNNRMCPMGSLQGILNQVGFFLITAYDFLNYEIDRDCSPPSPCYYSNFLITYWASSTDFTYLIFNSFFFLYLISRTGWETASTLVWQVYIEGSFSTNSKKLIVVFVSSSESKWSI